MSVQTTQEITRDIAEKKYVEFMLERPSFEREQKALAVLMGLDNEKTQEYMENIRKSEKIKQILLAQAMIMDNKELEDELDKLTIECGREFDNYAIIG